jgi:hypothetical protein
VTQRCITSDYEVQGLTFELWVDSDRNWWLSRNGAQWDESQLSYKELADIADYIEDWFTP